jgi:predicted nucleotidyltransferase component of viral defense system
MRYGSPAALRAALEHRLQIAAQESGVTLNRLRRRVIFERIVSRIESAEPGRWVLKGGMALEVRLADRARTTKDLDLGLREDKVDVVELRDRLIDSLAIDIDSDGFVFTVGTPTEVADSDLQTGLRANFADDRFLERLASLGVSGGQSPLLAF